MMWLAIIILILILFFVILIYNSLIAKKNRVASVFSTIDVMLKKRYDLIPQLVETVKGYVKHERGLLERITGLRSQAAGGRMVADIITCHSREACPREGGEQESRIHNHF